MDTNLIENEEQTELFPLLDKPQVSVQWLEYVTHCAHGLLNLTVVSSTFKLLLLQVTLIK